MKQKKLNTSYRLQDGNIRPILELPLEQGKQSMSKQKVYGTLTIAENTYSYVIKDPIWTYDSSSQMLEVSSGRGEHLRLEMCVRGEDVEALKELLGSLLRNESLENGLKSEDFKLAGEYLKAADIKNL